MTMLTFEQRKAAVLQALMRVSDELEKRIKARAQLDAAAKNLAAMTPVQRKVYIDAIKAKLNRIELEIAIAQAKRAAQPRPVVRKDMVNLQAQELLQRSRARKTAPAACSGPVCGHMRTPTGGRR
jgi:hypothetical protein